MLILLCLLISVCRDRK